MPRILLGLALAAIALPAGAADRGYVLTNYDRVRVEGPFDVKLTVGATSSASAKASADAETLANLDISVQGSTLVVRKGANGWSERGPVRGPAPVIVLAAPTLRSASIVGGGRLAIDGRIRAQRLDFQVAGAGAIDARGIDSDEAFVSLVGTGSVTLAGKSNRARLANNGTGTIAATALTVGDLVAVLDGSGETQATARFTADLTSTGLGRITVAGAAKCTVRGQASGPVVCGADAAP